MSFFTIKNRKLHFDLEYVLLHKPFADLYNDVKGEESDDYIKYFKYIYEIADNRSYSNKQGVSDKEAHENACNLANLETDFDKPKTLIPAIKYYKNKNYILNADTLKALLKTLNKTRKINARFDEALDNKLNNNEIKDSELSDIITLQTKLFNLIDDLPDKIRTIKRLESEVFEDLQREKELARGGVVISPSYEGDDEIDGLE